MLRSEHSIVRYDYQLRRVYPDRLRRNHDAVWLTAAESIINTYRMGIGSTRNELHQQVAETLERLPGCVPRRIAGFCKLLDDAGVYHKATADAAALRKRVFELSAAMHPIVETREGIFEKSLDDAHRLIADQIGLPWAEIADALFADVIELQRLRTFDETLEPHQLLARYNVAQTQTVLYKATVVRLDFAQHAPFIVRRAKLAGLMHRIQRFERADGPAYSMILDGPGSVLRESSRYGVRFAQLVPSLLCCDGWQLTAKIRSPGQHDDRAFRFELSPADGLRGERGEPDDFDSELERQIEQQWRNAPVDGWTLQRDREFLTLGQQVYTPDFVLLHLQSHRRIFIEVLGFWTPEYLREKRERLKKFSAATPGSGWLLMLDKKPTPAKQQLLDELSLPVITVKKSITPTQWIEAAKT